MQAGRAMRPGTMAQGAHQTIVIPENALLAKENSGFLLTPTASLRALAQYLTPRVSLLFEEG